jgi:hypothetical protein
LLSESTATAPGAQSPVWVVVQLLDVLLLWPNTTAAGILAVRPLLKGDSYPSTRLLRVSATYRLFCESTARLAPGLVVPIRRQSPVLLTLHALEIRLLWPITSAAGDSAWNAATLCHPSTRLL